MGHECCTGAKCRAILCAQFAAVLNESKKKCREWQAKAEQAEEQLERVRHLQTLLGDVANALHQDAAGRYIASPFKY